MSRNEFKFVGAVAIGIVSGFAVLAWLYFGVVAR